MNTTTVTMPAGQRYWDAARKPFASLDAIGWDLVEAAIGTPEGVGRLRSALDAACGQRYPGRGCVIDWTASVSAVASGVAILTPTSGTVIRVTADSLVVEMPHEASGYGGMFHSLGAGRLAQMQAALFGGGNE